MGPLTIRRALEQSRNIPSVKVIDMLGPTQVAAYAKKFGFSQDFRPFLSMALGAQEVTLLEITSAYSAFPNHGIRMEPYLAESITDRDGSLLEERRPQPRDAIRADTAYVLTNLMQGVVQHAPRRRERVELAVAGKTGRWTTNRRVVRRLRSEHPVGVWLGNDEKKPIGYNETGQPRRAMWMDFMKSTSSCTATARIRRTFESPATSCSCR